MRHYRKNLKGPSRRLRKEMTDAEQLLWFRLRRKQILGIQFYRQKPLGPYIVDFHAAAVNLVIEVDGGQHFEDGHLLRDAERDGFLKMRGIMVLRFDNRQVLLELESVVDEVFRVCGSRLNPP
ncbi:MAG TPA: endonuclease [Geobacter sp.]|nr:endonuclease [Geobacter sp.]